jgi:hypothetical protein
MQGCGVDDGDDDDVLHQNINRFLVLVYSETFPTP